MTRAELQSVVLHGHEIAFRIAGDGPVILLVHGMAGSGATWDPVFDLLARDHTVIAPDLPGHGESDKPVGSDYSLGALASSLRDLLLSTGHRGATVVGHSLGGGIAMQFAYQFPSRCERLVLVGARRSGPGCLTDASGAHVPGDGVPVPGPLRLTAPAMPERSRSRC